jgi:hypothetical protein
MIMTKVAELIPEELTEQELEVQLPIPVGYRLLVAMPEIEETYENTKLLKTYSDKERFGDKPWCNPGDYVMFRANTGTRFKVGGVEYRLMNDDSVEAVVNDPRGVTRA